MNIFEKVQSEFKKRVPWSKGHEGFKAIVRANLPNSTPKEREEGKAAKSKLAADVAAFAKEVDGEIDSLLPTMGAQAKALLGERPKRDEEKFSGKRGDELYTNAAQAYLYRIQKAGAVSEIKEPPSVAQATAVATTAPALTSEQIGRDVVSLATSEDPKIAAQARSHISALAGLAASQNSPRPAGQIVVPAVVAGQPVPTLPVDPATLMMQPEEERSAAMREIRKQTCRALDAMDDLDKQNEYIAAVKRLLPYSLQPDLVAGGVSAFLRNRKPTGLSTDNGIQSRGYVERPTRTGEQVWREVVTELNLATKVERTVRSVPIDDPALTAFNDEERRKAEAQAARDEAARLTKKAREIEAGR